MDFEIDQLRLEDTEAVVELMNSTPGVEFCPWENADFLLRQGQTLKEVALVAKHREQVIGVLLGGAFARRAMICHLAVADEWRRIHGVGSSLVKRALGCFSALDAGRVHLVVAKDNTSVLGYWKRLGFAVDRRCVTLECDISHPRSAPSTVRSAEIEDLEQIFNYIRSCGTDFHEWGAKASLAQELQAPESAVFLAETRGKVEGVAVGGSFAFRGQISHLHAFRPEVFSVLIESLKQRFFELGVLRIHTRVQRSDPNLSLWHAAGLREQEGEYTLSRAIPKLRPNPAGQTVPI